MQLPKSWLSFLTSFPIFNPISPVNEQDSYSLRQVTHISSDMDPIRMVTASHPPQGPETKHFLSQQQELQQPHSIRASTGAGEGGSTGQDAEGPVQRIAGKQVCRLCSAPGAPAAAPALGGLCCPRTAVLDALQGSSQSTTCTHRPRLRCSAAAKPVGHPETATDLLTMPPCCEMSSGTPARVTLLGSCSRYSALGRLSQPLSEGQIP